MFYLFLTFFPYIFAYFRTNQRFIVIQKSAHIKQYSLYIYTGSCHQLKY
jgi:transglutaminase/protease-like cytokinesis protein 3